MGARSSASGQLLSSRREARLRTVADVTGPFEGAAGRRCSTAVADADALFLPGRSLCRAPRSRGAAPALDRRRLGWPAAGGRPGRDDVPDRPRRRSVGALLVPGSAAELAEQALHLVTAAPAPVAPVARAPQVAGEAAAGGVRSGGTGGLVVDHPVRANAAPGGHLIRPSASRTGPRRGLAGTPAGGMLPGAAGAPGARPEEVGHAWLAGTGSAPAAAAAPHRRRRGARPGRRPGCVRRSGVP